MGKSLGLAKAAAFAAALTYATPSSAVDQQLGPRPKPTINHNNQSKRAQDKPAVAKGVALQASGTTSSEYDVAAVAPSPRKSRAAKSSAGGDVFGSIAIPIGKIPIRRQWDHAVSFSIDDILEPNCREPRLCKSGFSNRIQSIKQKASGLSERDLISLVNREINKVITYRPDSTNYGRKEHWASIREVAKISSGDCEDYAITKMLLLKSLGISSKHMRLVGLKDNTRGLYHAVLAVRTGKEFLILDNLSDSVRRDVDLKHYQPIFSFTTTASYIHGFKGRPISSPKMATIHLGAEP